MDLMSNFYYLFSFTSFFSKNNFELQPTYYCFLNIWLCSFSEKSYEIF